MIGGRIACWECGEWTDDTQQAIIVCQAKADPLDVAEGLLAWYRQGPADVGVSTGRVLSQVRHAGDMALIAREHAVAVAGRPVPRGWDPGMANGSLMRTGPVALPLLGDENSIAARAREVSDLTHAEPYAGDACVLWSLAIGRAVEVGQQLDLAQAFAHGIEVLPGDRRGFRSRIVAGALDVTPTGRQNGSAVGAFKSALWAVARGDSLEDTLQLAIAPGGDTDTVASIAGALAGALHGVSAVPAEWRDVLHGWPGLRAGELQALA